MKQISIFLVLILIAIRTGGGAEPISNEAREFFETRIRPVLIDQCYSCHNSTKQADGELRLDDRAGTRKGGEHGAIIVPGRVQDSRLIPILKHEIPDLRMPQGGARLDDRVIADFETWIAMGAPDPRDQPPTAEELSNETSWEAIVSRRKHWWSLQPVKATAAPVIAGQSWSDHPVDHFIFAKLREHELQPVERAAPSDLVRRAFLTLIGLPPTAEEVEQWAPRVGKTSGYEELVDHLLNSPHYGERWARHWMDWIRYCDSHGSEGDPTIENGWQYRDYLIRALNADLPYDQLVREHIAGDLLEPPRINTALGINESLIATAHWRMVFHGFSPTDALDEKVRFIDDQVNAFSKAFLGLTVSCARCHDHKFDAISQQDYYALFGIFSSCRPGRSAINLPSQHSAHRAKLRELKQQIRNSMADTWMAALPTVRSQLLASDGDWKRSENPKQVLHAWSLLRKDLEAGQTFDQAWNLRTTAWNHERQVGREFAQRASFQRWSLDRKEDFDNWTRTGAGLADDQPAAAGEFTVASSGDALLTGIYPAGVYSHRLSEKDPARLTSRDLKLDGEYVVYLRTLGEGSSGRYVVYDYPREGTVYPVAQFKNEWQWARLDMSYWSGDVVHFEITESADAPLMARNEPRSWFGVRQVVVLKKSEPPPPEAIEFLDPWFNISAAKQPVSLEQAADQFVATLSDAIQNWSKGTCNDSQALLLDASARQGLLPNRLPDIGAPATGESATTLPLLITEYRRLEAELPTPIRIPTLEETSDRTQPLYVRGNHKQPAEIVPRGFLGIINPEPYASIESGRRQLAEDLLRPDNPLTRRVIANRLWHHLFGCGIVATPDNFGKLGHAPTHPELLDHLATQFLNDGGSLKQMIRYLVTSQTWQLSSNPPAEAARLDPDNRWLSHARVRRLEAEAIRDSLLVVSGRLNRDLYGAPVDAGSSRRSVYLRVQRNSLDPFLRAFDFPEPFTAVGRRDVTNVPAQSLTMMNDERVWSLADAWASRVLGDRNVSDHERIQRMFLTALGRPAQPHEIRKLQDYLSAVSVEQVETAKQAAELKRTIDQHQTSIGRTLDAVRAKLLAQATGNSDRDQPTGPQPSASWDFRTDLNDRVGPLHLELRQGATLQGGAISTQRGGFAVSAPLNRTIKAKTLEAWVQLENLEQQGGGVMTIQTRGGEFFDSIVFAEHSPRQWMAGSNFFERTSPFNGPVELEAATRPVHLAIAYHADGTIAAYRDGRPYGTPYKSRGPIEFKAGEAIISFGIRHLPTGGNRMLAGRIVRANLYDRALTADEIAATSRSAGAIFTEAELIAALDESSRTSLRNSQQAVAELKKQLDALNPGSGTIENQNPWTDLARAMFLFKEFLFVK